MDTGGTVAGENNLGGQAGQMQAGGMAGDSPSNVGGQMLDDEFMQGLIGYWSFDEGQGSMLADHSGNGNHGEIVSGTTWGTSKPVDDPPWVDGKRGKALRFSPNGIWVRIRDSESLDSTGRTDSITIAAWVTIDGFDRSGFNWIASRQHLPRATHEHFGFGLLGGRPVVHFEDRKSQASQSLMADTQWHHVAVTYGGPETFSRFYVDGEEFDIGFPAETMGEDVTGLAIGANNNREMKEYWHGSLDDLWLFNRALSPSEIRRLATP